MKESWKDRELTLKTEHKIPMARAVAPIIAEEKWIRPTPETFIVTRNYRAHIMQIPTAADIVSGATYTCLEDESTDAISVQISIPCREAGSNPELHATVTLKLYGVSRDIFEVLQ